MEKGKHNLQQEICIHILFIPMYTRRIIIIITFQIENRGFLERNRKM